MPRNPERGAEEIDLDAAIEHASAQLLVPKAQPRESVGALLIFDAPVAAGDLEDALRVRLGLEDTQGLARFTVNGARITSCLVPTPGTVDGG